MLSQLNNYVGSIKYFTIHIKTKYCGETKKNFVVSNESFSECTFTELSKNFLNLHELEIFSVKGKKVLREALINICRRNKVLFLKTNLI